MFAPGGLLLGGCLLLGCLLIGGVSTRGSAPRGRPQVCVRVISQKTRKHSCNSMPFSAAWAYYGNVLVLANAASLNGCVCGEVK